MDKVEIVKFNVGGRKYEVSRSLLELHPNTLLAKSAAMVWEENSEEEIFFERDGARFAFCLDYLRDEKCYLPSEVSKEALMDDLHYFGVENVHSNLILQNRHEDSKLSAVVNLSGDVISRIDNEIEDLRFISFLFKRLGRGESIPFFVNTEQIPHYMTPFKKYLKRRVTNTRVIFFAKYGIDISNEGPNIRIKLI